MTPAVLPKPAVLAARATPLRHVTWAVASTAPGSFAPVMEVALSHGKDPAPTSQDKQRREEKSPSNTPAAEGLILAVVPATVPTSAGPPEREMESGPSEPAQRGPPASFLPSGATPPAPAPAKESSKGEGILEPMAQKSFSVADGAPHSDQAGLPGDSSATPMAWPRWPALPFTDVSPKATAATPDEAPAGSANPAGTTAAIQSKEMNLSRKTANFSAPTEQFLPTGVTGAEVAGLGAPPPVKMPVGRDELRQSMALADAALAWLSPGAPVQTELSRPAPESGMTFGLMAQAQVILSDLALKLQHVDHRSLSAVVVLDGQTELFFHLRMQDGHIEALAQCRRGDVAVLDAQWSHLQSQLATQGIRLATLERAGSPAPHDSPGFDSRGQRRPQDEPAPTFTALPRETVKARRRVSRAALASRGWETWA